MKFIFSITPHFLSSFCHAGVSAQLDLLDLQVMRIYLERRARQFFLSIRYSSSLYSVVILCKARLDQYVSIYERQQFFATPVSVMCGENQLA